jgi:hypothetical protein
MPAGMTLSWIVENTMRAGNPIQIIVEVITPTGKTKRKTGCGKSLRQTVIPDSPWHGVYLPWIIPETNKSPSLQECDSR